MLNRSAISRAHVVEFQEATEEEAFDFLKDLLGEVKFNKKKNELVDLVKNYTGGKFKTLVDVAKGVDDLQGLVLVVYSHCFCYGDIVFRKDASTSRRCDKAFSIV